MTLHANLMINSIGGLNLYCKGTIVISRSLSPWRSRSSKVLRKINIFYKDLLIVEYRDLNSINVQDRKKTSSKIGFV